MRGFSCVDSCSHREGSWLTVIISFIPSSEVDVKDIVQHRDSEASKSHLELDQLGRVLKAISNRLPGTAHAQHHALTVDTLSSHCSGAVCQQRTFDAGLLKAGLPNLLVTSSGSVRHCATSL